MDNVQRHEILAGKDQWLKRRKRTFDRVLVDAPCSGVGAWRRNPDARWLLPSAARRHRSASARASASARSHAVSGTGGGGAASASAAASTRTQGESGRLGAGE